MLNLVLLRHPDQALLRRLATASQSEALSEALSGARTLGHVLAGARRHISVEPVAIVVQGPKVLCIPVEGPVGPMWITLVTPVFAQITLRKSPLIVLLCN